MFIILFLALSVTAALPSVTLIGDLRRTGPPIANVFSTITLWEPPYDYPLAPGLTSAYPFLEFAELFTATGGCYDGYPNCTSTRDLFIDNSDASSGVNATRLVSAVRNILDAGLKPHIVTGNVPIALSTEPSIRSFGVNAAPPANLSAYRGYIAGIAGALRDAFGLSAMASWRWGVFTEYNNQDWLAGSAIDFANLFDFTVCGLEDVLGAANVNIGAHACLQCGGSGTWDPLLFLEHAASGVSACTGGRVHLNFTATSFYEHTAGQPGDLSGWASGAGAVLDRARALGLPAVTFGVDEGRLLWGSEGSAYALNSRAVGDAYQASWDALFFRVLVGCLPAATYYSRWNLNAAGLGQPNTTVDSAAVNTAQLAHRLTGMSWVPLVNSSGGGGSDPLSIVDGVAGASPAAVTILLFHHHPALNTTAVVPISAELSLCGASAPPGPLTAATVTRVSDEVANFWPLWRSDAMASGLSHANGDYSPGWSADSDAPPLQSEKAKAVFSDGLARYRAAAAMQATPIAAAVGTDGCVRLTLDMPPHSVALVELEY
jgi:hypothetical protein